MRNKYFHFVLSINKFLLLIIFLRAIILTRNFHNSLINENFWKLICYINNKIEIPGQILSLFLFEKFFMLELFNFNNYESNATKFLQN